MCQKPVFLAIIHHKRRHERMGSSEQQDRPKSKAMRSCEREAGEKWNKVMISRIRHKFRSLGDKGAKQEAHIATKRNLIVT